MTAARARASRAHQEPDQDADDSDQQGASTCDACDHLGAKMNLSRGRSGAVRGGADKAGRGTRGCTA